MLANWTNKFQQYYMVINLVVYPHGRMSELAALICSSAWAASLSMAARHNWKRHQSSQAEWGVPWRLCSPTQVAGKNTIATRRTLSNREEGERDTDKIKEEHESSDEIRVGRPGLPLAHPRALHAPQSTYLSVWYSTARVLVFADWLFLRSLCRY